MLDIQTQLDDGPNAVNTVTALEAFRTRNLPGTFFVVGQEVLSNPATLRRAYQEGHEIAIHSWSHSDLATLTDDQIVAELVWTARIVKDTIGQTPTLFRPPYGSTNARVLRLANGMGLRVVNWNRDTNDWLFSFYPDQRPSAPYNPTDTPSAIAANFQRWVAEPMRGTISLQHDIRPAPASQVGPALDILRQSQYRLVTVSECLRTTAYNDQLLNRINFNSNSQPPPPPSSPSSTSDPFRPPTSSNPLFSPTSSNEVTRPRTTTQDRPQPSTTSSASSTTSSANSRPTGPSVSVRSGAPKVYASLIGMIAAAWFLAL